MPSVRPVLILGASGFIGSHVRRALERQLPNQPWVGVHWDPAHDAPSGQGCWLARDLVTTRATAFEVLLDEINPAAVVNCVGATGGPATVLQAVNVDMVRSLLLALSRHPDCVLVHIGSAAEYGPQPSSAPVSEFALPHPVGVYGVTKLASTELARAAFLEGRVRGSVLRVFNPVGAGAPSSSLAGRAAQAIRYAQLHNIDFITLGPLADRRDFLAAEDVGTAVIKTLQLPVSPPVLNVGRGVAMSGAALITLLEETSGFDGDILEAARGSGRSSLVASQRADVGLLRGALGWVPSTPLACAVGELWADVVGSGTRRRTPGCGTAMGPASPAPHTHQPAQARSRLPDLKALSSVAARRGCL
jgi:nucleoside-diphosphate-sugar epimerase